MSRSIRFGGVSTLATMVALGLCGPAFAQETEPAESEVIVVTGSHIRGTPETTALPVDVITTADLEAQGNPTMVDLIKSIPSSASVFGDANQFTAGQSGGSGNVNLRSLGPPRTLVLLNGRRVVIGPALNGGVDTNLLPSNAIGRIEVLKDGAASIYGSDAIGGVVNFLTRRDLDGLEFNGNLSHIDGSDGDFDAGANWGWVGDRGNVLLSVGVRHRSELDTLERDFAHRPFDDFHAAAIGGWSSFSNSGPFFTSPALANRFVDPACNDLGGFAQPAPPALTQTCRFQFAQFNNLVEDEDHYQIYGEFNYAFTPTLDFHVEALWAGHYVEAEHSSPSYGPVQGPGALANGTGIAALAGHFVIPETNPGLTPAFVAQLRPEAQTHLGAVGTQNLYTLGLFWRPLGTGGNPLYDDGSKQDQRNFEGWRISASFDGELGDNVEWTLAGTFGENQSDISTSDMIVSRLGYALRGLGGPSCDTDPITPGVQGTPGVAGCMWFNPFSTGIAVNPATGDTNTLTFDASTVNSLDLIDWLFEEYAYQVRTQELTVDLIFNGESNITLPGGAISWALGGQYRNQAAQREVNDFTNIAINPCVNLGDTSCAQQNGAFSFFGPLSNYDLNKDNYALFGELRLPILDSLEAQVAVRFEDYGDLGGDTTNPKLSLRWQLFDALALRGSVGTTFRTPPLVQLDPNFTTLLAFTSAVTGYRAYDTFGNPDLQPETAFTYNIGAIVDAGPLRATIDYFHFDFEDPIMPEGGTRMATALFVVIDPITGLPIPGMNHCNEPAYAGLQSRFTFALGTCSPGNMLRAEVHTINGPALTVSGVDASATLDLGDLFGGDAGRFYIGGDVTYIDEWSQEDLFVEGILTRPAQNYAGAYDHAGGQFNSTPQWKGSAYAEFTGDRLQLRWTTRYVGEMVDLRPICQEVVLPQCPAGEHETKLIDAFITHDVTAVYDLTNDLTLTAGVLNLFDEDPPFAGTDLGYDPFTANPVGRVFRIGARQRF